MSKSSTTRLATDADNVDAAWVSDQDAPCWHVRLSLPPGAAPEAIPKDLQGLITSLFDALLHRHRVTPPDQPAPPLRWRAAAAGPSLRDGPGYWKDFQAIMERFWRTRLRLDLVAPDALPRITFESSMPAGERVGPDESASMTAARPATAVTFTPDVDSLAAISRLLDARQEPVLVLWEAITAHRATWQDALRSILETCRGRVASITVHAPRGQERVLDAALLAFPEDWRLLHVLAAASVALACSISEVQVPQNGVANLNLPVTAEAISRPANPIDPELTSSLSHLLSRMTGSTIRIRNPLLADTPSELVADLIERGSRRLDVNIDAIRGLVQDDNTYERRVDHTVSILGALHAGSSLAEEYELMLMHELLLPTNQGFADTYVRSLRELPAMSDRDVISRLDESVAGAAAGRIQRTLAIGLLRRHAESVLCVLARALQRYAHDIVAGTLASTCLLMRAALPGDPQATASDARKPMFRKLGKVTDCWEIWFEEGEAIYLKGSKGLDYIHVLLQAPGSTFSPVELRDAIAGHGRMPASNLGPLADARAVQRYRRQLAELRADLDLATEHNDIGRSERILYEIEALEQELSRSVGLGGRLRQDSDTERARKSVSNAIYRALQQLRARHPALARHLSAALKIGNGMGYLPADAHDWQT
jgi:hypothetical protein